MQKLFSEKKIVFFLLGFFLLVFLYLAYSSEATYDAGDGIRHYLVSRYSWKHPELLLYSWGKPFFTFISSPFSQFGLLGINIFNILCGIGSAFFAYKIAKKQKLNYAVLAIPFLLFTPCYFPTLNSGLTEPFFGFILIISIFLMYADQYVLAAIIVSFLPFVRSEGNFLLPLFFVVLVYRKKFLSVPLLAFGTVIYSIIGSFYYHDFLWVKNQNPYNGENKAFYGSGDLYHFVSNHNFIWGNALGWLFIAGLAAAIFNSFRSIKKKEAGESKLPEEIFLIYGSFIIYFVAHSIMWWKGLANSLGLLRVLAGVIPCSALICLRGFDILMIPFLRGKKIFEFIIITAVTIWVIRSPFKHEYFPYKLDKEQALIKQTGDWFKTSPYTKQKVYYLYPLLAHVLNVDPFDPDKVGELWGLYPTIKKWGISAIPDSSIVFWDAHFGPNECKIPLDTIMNDPNFELIKTFTPEVPFKVLGNYDFSVNVFIKLKQPKKLELLTTDFFDLETLNPLLLNTESITSKNAFSGDKKCELSQNAEYSVTVKKRMSEILRNTKAVDFSCKLSDPSSNSKEAIIIMSIDDNSGKNLLWDGKPIVLNPTNDHSEWMDASAHFVLNTNSYPVSSSIKFYIWNKAKKNFSIDDITVNYYGIK